MQIFFCGAGQKKETDQKKENKERERVINVINDVIKNKKEKQNISNVEERKNVC